MRAVHKDTDNRQTHIYTGLLFAVCTQYTGFKLKWKDFITVSIPIWIANPHWAHSFIPGISFNWPHSFFSLFECFLSPIYISIHTVESYRSFVFCAIHKINNLVGCRFSDILMLNVEMISISGRNFFRLTLEQFLWKLIDQCIAKIGMRYGPQYAWNLKR